MYPLTQIKLKYIGFRIEGMFRGRDYQAASGNSNLKSCHNLGSRMEKNDPRIIEKIREGLELKRQAIEGERLLKYAEQLKKINEIKELKRIDKELETRSEKLKPETRDDRQLEIHNAYPTPAECAYGTLKGTIQRPSGAHTMPLPQAKKKPRDYVWGGR